MNKEKIKVATKVFARTPSKKAYTFKMLTNLTEKMENFKLNEYHQNRLEEYLYPEKPTPKPPKKILASYTLKKIYKLINRYKFWIFLTKIIQLKITTKIKLHKPLFLPKTNTNLN